MYTSKALGNVFEKEEDKDSMDPLQTLQKEIVNGHLVYPWKVWLTIQELSGIGEQPNKITDAIVSSCALVGVKVDKN